VSTTTVELAAEARLIVSIHRNIRMDVGLRYNADDPLAVRMAFPAEYSLDHVTAPHPANEVEWVFARTLLAAGLELPSGDGDVRIRPVPHQAIVVELLSAEGIALLVFKARKIREFLWHTYQLVGEGQENNLINADRAIEELLRCR
jgi:hypothetical protein